MLLTLAFVAVGAEDCLEFVHIPKTGGTSIEATGAAHNLTWGACHFDVREVEALDCEPDLKMCRIDRVPAWHAPPALHTDACGIPGYKRCKTFTVVRNPIKRAASFFYCKWWGPAKKHGMDAWVAKNFHRWTPQHKFLPVDYILRYESLEEEFADLMRNFKLNFNLTEHRNKGLPPPLDSTERLSNTTICSLANHFKDDFLAFGYPLPSACTTDPR